MPYYYLIPETDCITNNEPICGWSKRWKPETYDLLLPSIHASRGHNVLQAGDPGQAVADLLASCRDSTVWPSSRFQNGLQDDFSDNSEATNFRTEVENHTKAVVEEKKPVEIPKVVPPKLPTYAKYRPRFWSQDVTDPYLINAARSLFFETKKQQSQYQTTLSPWDYPSRPPRVPTDYELFVAWASLSRSEKMMYISEVTNGSSGDSNQMPINSLETDRAVNALYSSCSDAGFWPSLEFLRSQHHHHPPLYAPRWHNPALPISRPF